MTRHWYKRIWRRQRKPFAVLEQQLAETRLALTQDLLAFAALGVSQKTEAERQHSLQQVVRIRRVLEKGDHHGVSYE